MSIPGFLTANEQETAPTVVEVEIQHLSEWRIEVPFKTVMKLKVLEGVGEVFGTELSNDVEIRLTGVKCAVYAPLTSGCKLQYELAPNKDNMNISNEDGYISEYISDESAVPNYQALHFALEVLRLEAESDNSKKGPRVLILGDSQVGKTAMARTLASFAVKMERIPLLVNLDPKEGVFSAPGSITATPISDSLDIESSNMWGDSPTLGGTFHNPKQPLVKSYGFESTKENIELYKYQVSQLGVASLSRMAEDDALRVGGAIIDTPPLNMNDFTVVENIVSDFEVDLIVVIGNDRLNVDLKRKFKHKVSKGTLNVVKVGRSGGVTPVDEFFVRKVQEDTIKEYFNGNYRTRLSPSKFDVEISTFVIYKPVSLSEYTSLLAFLPSGDSYAAEESVSEEKKEENTLDKFFLRFENPDSSNLENSIVAITHVPAVVGGKLLPRELLNSSILGYAHVSRVDDVKKTMSLLVPFPGQVPRNVLIATHIGYTE